MVSVIIPVLNEEKYISHCLTSITDQDFPKEEMEVICVDGMSTDRTREIITEFSEKHKYIRLLDNHDRIVSYALNTGIKASYGSVIMRIDAHCKYPANYISTLVRKLKELEADNVGAVINSLPACKSSLCKAIAVGSANKFGVGNSAFRVGSDKIQEADTVPFGCFRRDIFDRIGLFDTDLIRNQDDEFNGRIIKNGGKIYLVPEVSVDYYARETPGKMARMFYQYALFKTLVNRKLGAPATVRQLVPPLFISAIIGGALLSILFPIVVPIFFSGIILYIIMSFGVSLLQSVKYRSVSLFFILPMIFLVIHLSYGWGYLTGMLKFGILKSNSVTAEVNR